MKFSEPIESFRNSGFFLIGISPGWPDFLVAGRKVAKISGNILNE
jgi:hypothetical protein